MTVIEKQREQLTEKIRALRDKVTDRARVMDTLGPRDNKGNRHTQSWDKGNFNQYGKTMI